MNFTGDYINHIITGSCTDILPQLPSNSIDLVITSPPYFQQRDYGNGVHGIGNEPTEAEYLQHILAVFEQCVRVVKDSGAVVFNLGDKYINGGLSLLPYKFALAANSLPQVFMVNQLTWAKLNPTPRQDKRKLIQATEPFFIFAKSKNYQFYLDDYLAHLDELNKSSRSNSPTENMGKKYVEIIEKSDLSSTEKSHAKQALQQAIAAVKSGEIDSFRMKIRGVHKLAYGGQDGGRNNQIKQNGFTIIKLLGNKMKKDLIESPVEITKDNEHPAVYPIYIIQELIKLLSTENDIVLDPFCGSGTTCLAARNLNRRYVGIEINADYAHLSRQRLYNTPIIQELFV